MNEKYSHYLKKYIPYAIIFLFTFFACYLLFLNNAYPKGDDSDYHFANIYDAYKALLEGNTSLISPYLASGVGVGKKLFYSPIPHLVVAGIGVILTPFNISLLTSFKLVIFLSIFISGIFMYRLGMRISKNKIIPALIASAIFVLYPYRLFDFYCRIAFAEGIAIMFLPLFYMGLYDILNNDKERILPYIEVVLGAVLLFLSHNITALYAFIFGIIYIIVNYKKAIKLIKNKNTLVYSIISICLILGLALFNIITQITLLNMDFYNISVPERMWTNVEAVKSRTYDCLCYSGFLNFPWLTSSYGNIFSNDNLTMSLILFVLYSSLAIIIDLALKDIKKLKYFHFIISFSIYFLLIGFTINRLEIFLGGIIFSVLYLFISLNKGNTSNEKINKNIDFWYYVVMILVVLILITQDYVWYIMPEALLKIQFPWRLWAFVSLYASIIIVNILSSTKGKFASIFVSIVTGFLMVSNQPLLEKRLNYQFNYNSSSFIDEVDENVYNNFMSIGANLEYFPKNFYLGSGYKSNYNNSLYYKIYNEIWSSFNKNPYSFTPVLLEGEGNIEVIDKKAPVYDMNITITEDGLVQLPLLYYPGYSIIADSNEKIEVIEVDGLVAFKLNKGEYHITTNYVGTTTMNMSYVIRYISYAGLIVFVCYGFIVEMRRKEGLF